MGEPNTRAAMQAVRDELVAKHQAEDAERQREVQLLAGIDAYLGTEASEISGGGEAPGDPQPPTPAPSGARTYPCPDCGLDRFTSPQAMGAHRRRAHPGSATRGRAAANTPPPAPDPPLSGFRPPVRERPPRPKGATGGTPVDLICDECHEAHPTPGSLRIHKRKQHGDEQEVA